MRELRQVLRLVTVKMPEIYVEIIDEYAAMKGITRSEAIREAIRKAIIEQMTRKPGQDIYPVEQVTVVEVVE